MWKLKSMKDDFIKLKKDYSVQFSCSVMSDSLQPQGLQHARLPCPLPLLELAQTHIHWISDAVQPAHPLSSPSPPAFSLSQNQGFSNELALCIRWPKYWSFSFNIIPSNEYAVLISFRMDCFDLLAVQQPFKSLLQYHSLKALILRCSAFFMVQPTSIYDYC